jgi:hypothetical protein
MNNAQIGDLARLMLKDFDIPAWEAEHQDIGAIKDPRCEWDSEMIREVARDHGYPEPGEYDERLVRDIYEIELRDAIAATQRDTV